VQRGTEITEAKAKINSRSSTESNNNIPEQEGASGADSRRDEIERGFPPSQSLQQISRTECRLDGSLCSMAVGCRARDGPGNVSGVVSPSGISPQEPKQQTGLKEGIKAPM